MSRTSAGKERIRPAGLLRGAALTLRVSYRASPWLTLLALVLTPAAQVLMVLGGLWLKVLADAVLVQDLRRAMLAAGLMALSGGATFLVFGAGNQIRSSLTELAGIEFDKLIVSVTAGIPTIEHHERPEYLDRLQRLREHAEELKQAVNTFFVVLMATAHAVAALALLVRLDPVLLLLPLFWFPRHMANAAVLRWLADAWDRDAEAVRTLDHIERLAISPDTAKEVLISGLERELLRRHHDLTRSVARRRMAAHWRGTRAQLATAVFSAAAYAGAVALIALRASLGQATVGDVLMAVFVVAQVGYALSAVAYGGNWLLRAMRRVVDVIWLLDYARAVPRPESSVPTPDSIRQGVTFSGVSFRYPGTERWVLRGVDLHLPPGSVVALVGENGAGKTSLIKLLCRFYDPTEGTVAVDGVDTRRFAHDEWRSRLAAGYQDFVRFELLARETVGVGDLPRIEEVSAVDAALARAGGDGVVERLPEGIETQLGQRWDGVELSGGQWQRLALARAFMRERPLLLILDEPTSALDAPAEHALFERFADAARRAGDTGMITLLVSHRFSTVRMADLIVVLDGGRVREVGSHDELRRLGGLYAELYEIQARAYR